MNNNEEHCIWRAPAHECGQRRRGSAGALQIQCSSFSTGIVRPINVISDKKLCARRSLSLRADLSSPRCLLLADRAKACSVFAGALKDRPGYSPDNLCAFWCIFDKIDVLRRLHLLQS